MNKDKYIIGLVALIVGVIIGAVLFHSSAPKVGNQVQNDQYNFVSGLNAGNTNQLKVDGSGNLTAAGTGLNQINNFVENGAVTAISVGAAYSTTTLTTAQACQSTFINVTPLGAAATVTFPATSTAFFAGCLPSVGSVDYLNYMSTATSTTIAAGAGGTLGYSTSASVAAGKYALIRLIRDTASTYKIWVLNVAN